MVYTSAAAGVSICYPSPEWSDKRIMLMHAYNIAAFEVYLHEPKMKPDNYNTCIHALNERAIK